jgi:hypothetical protein
MAAFMARPDRNITRCTVTGKQRVKIIRRGVTYELGRFDTVEEARVARDAFVDPRKDALEARAVRVDRQMARAEGTPFIDPRPERYAEHQAALNAWQTHLDDPERAALQAQLDDRLYTHLQGMVRSGIPPELVRQAAGLSVLELGELTHRVLAARNAAA